jgi:hypothetical protein
VSEQCKACRSKIIDACESIGVAVQELKTALATIDLEELSAKERARA